MNQVYFVMDDKGVSGRSVSKYGSRRGRRTAAAAVACGERSGGGGCGAPAARRSPREAPRAARRHRRPRAPPPRDPRDLRPTHPLCLLRARALSTYQLIQCYSYRTVLGAYHLLSAFS